MLPRVAILAVALLAASAAAEDGPADRYVFGEATLAVPADVEPGTAYRLTASGATLAEGAVPPAREVATPPVRGRLRTTLAIEGQPDASVVVLPADQRDRLSEVAAGLRVAIVGPADAAVAGLLPGARGVDRPIDLRLATFDAVVVAPDALAETPPGEQRFLAELAAAGVPVLVLRQPARDLFGVKIAEPEAVSLVWKPDPLVGRLRRLLAAGDLQPLSAVSTLDAETGTPLALSDDDDKPRAAALRTTDGVILWQVPFADGDARLALLLTAFLEEATE